MFRSLCKKMFDVETFIEAVKERQALYNVNHKNYNRKDVRARLWAEIGQIMYPEWMSFDFRDKNEKVLVMQKKWKSLKDCFNREIRLQKTEDPKKLRKKYEFYDRLSFLLRKHNPEPVKPVAPISEVRIKLEKIANSEPEVRIPTHSLNLSNPQLSSSQNHLGVSAPEGNSRKRKAVSKEGFPKGSKPKPQNRAEEAEDGDRLFLLSFATDLRKLPLTTKYWVKMKFSEIMHQAAMSLDGCPDADHASTSVDYEQEIGSPASVYPADFPEEESPSDPPSEIYDLYQD